MTEYVLVSQYKYIELFLNKPIRKRLIFSLQFACKDHLKARCQVINYLCAQIIQMQYELITNWPDSPLL